MGLTQKELGKKIYKSEITIRKYESGNVNIPPSVLYNLCSIFNVSGPTMLGDDFESYMKEKLNTRPSEELVGLLDLDNSDDAFNVDKSGNIEKVNTHANAIDSILSILSYGMEKGKIKNFDSMTTEEMELILSTTVNNLAGMIDLMISVRQEKEDE